MPLEVIIEWLFAEYDPRICVLLVEARLDLVHALENTSEVLSSREYQERRIGMARRPGTGQMYVGYVVLKVWCRETILFRGLLEHKMQYNLDESVSHNSRSWRRPCVPERSRRMLTTEVS